MSVISKIKNLISKPKISISKDRILVLGDSHSRGFSFNENFFPLFLGAGKEINLVNDKNFERLKSRILKIAEQFKENKVILYLCEPDCRFYLGKGWYPWDENKWVKENIDVEKAILASINRYSMLIDYVKTLFEKEVIVMNVTPSTRVEQNKIVLQFNEGLSKLCAKKELLFLEINSSIFSNDEKVLKEKYYADHVHLDTSIQELVEEVLISKNIISERRYNTETKQSNSEISNMYKFDKRFGCYVLK